MITLIHILIRVSKVPINYKSQHEILCEINILGHYFRLKLAIKSLRDNRDYSELIQLLV